VPLISTSLERTSLPECSAINFLYSFGCDFDWSPWDRFESSPPELSDPSPIDEIVLCGMNFFNTHHHCNGYSHCQRVRWRKANFFIIYPQIGTTWPFYFGRKEQDTPALGSVSGQEFGQPLVPERSDATARLNSDRFGPNRSQKPIRCADFEGAGERFGDHPPEKIERCR